MTGSAAFVSTDGRLVAMTRPGRVSLGTWGERALDVDGALAEDLTRALADGRLGERDLARLRAAIAALGVQAVSPAELAAATFRHATAADLLRRERWSELFIELVSACEARCCHCYADAAAARTAALDLDTVVRLLDEAVALGFGNVQFTGGDPVLCSFLVEVARRARELGLDVEVFTSGLSLDAPRAKALVQLGVAFAFSLYSDRADEHDAITGVPGSFVRTRAAIELVRAAGGRVRIGVIAMEANLPRLRGALELARALSTDASSASFDLARRVGRGGALGPELSVPPDVVAALRTDDAKQGRCSARAGLGRLCVAADGMVYPCILARGIGLGRVGTSAGSDEATRSWRGLREVLAHPEAQFAWQAAAGKDEAMTAFLSSRLSCVECQLTARILLEGDHAA